jgi:RNA polymerase sigma-B factor
MSGAKDPRGSREVSAREQLITTHLGLAHHLARKFADRGEAHEDLLQAAYLALVKAADRFDPTLGFEFSTYATRMILGELKHHFRDTGWAVRAPRQVQELYLEVNATVTELTQRLGRSPTVPEIATACRRRVDEVLSAIEAGRGYRATSLDAEVDGVPALHERVENPEPAPDAALDDRHELSSHLARLAPDDRELLRLRFVDELSQSEIAKRLGVSQMQVSRLLRKALDQLRSSYRAAR